MNEVVEIAILDHQNLGGSSGDSRSGVKKWGDQKRPADSLSRRINIIFSAIFGTNGNSPLFKNIESFGPRALLAEAYARTYIFFFEEMGNALQFPFCKPLKEINFPEPVCTDQLSSPGRYFTLGICLLFLFLRHFWKSFLSASHRR